jgi:serine protease Do
MDSLPKFSAFVYLHPRDVPMQMEVLRGNQTVKRSIDPVDVPGGIDSLADLVDPQSGLVADLGSLLLIRINGSLQCFRIFGRSRESS